MREDIGANHATICSGFRIRQSVKAQGIDREPIQRHRQLISLSQSVLQDIYIGVGIGRINNPAAKRPNGIARIKQIFECRKRTVFRVPKRRTESRHSVVKGCRDATICTCFINIAQGFIKGRVIALNKRSLETMEADIDRVPGHVIGMREGDSIKHDAPPCRYDHRLQPVREHGQVTRRDLPPDGRHRQ